LKEVAAAGAKQIAKVSLDLGPDSCAERIRVKCQRAEDECVDSAMKILGVTA